ncbi:MAG: peptidoglycan editing factor PgeF [Nitrospirae bacterium]|nr:MAG: peptidoglycan editing factor PgeF [Nitrospirota bacterium]
MPADTEQEMAATHITVPAFAGTRDGVRHFFGTRHRPGDVASLTTSKRQIVVSVKQVHGTDALVLDRPVAEGETFAGGWDALVTDQTDVLLTVRTADCVPVLVHDPVQRVVAAIHAGWRGAVAGIVPRTLAVMARRFGSDPGSLRVGIGPSAGPCCYEVDEPVLGRLREDFGDWRTVVQETGRGKAILDLRALVRRQVQAVGVEEEGIRTVNVCTICYPDLFYSYRREGAVRGTMVSGIMLSRRVATR